MDISEKYNLMEITKDKLDQISENSVGPGVHVGLLYGMPIILYNIGKNTSSIQNAVSDLSKYNHPSLALNYGFLVDSSTPQDYQETDKVYIVRELVKGKNFHNILSYHIHDRLVLLYKLICLLEFLHSFDVYYLFLHPSKIIITDDIEIKLVDHIKINDDILNNVRLQSLNDETKFLSPEFYSFNVKLDKLDKEALTKIDLYEFACILFYSVTGELPWSKLDSKEEITKIWNSSNLNNNNNNSSNNNSNSSNNSCKTSFLESEESYPNDIKKVYSILENLLNYKSITTEQVRIQMEELPEIKDYNKHGTLMFDFEEECKKVMENIEDLIFEIDKSCDENNISRHFNSINHSNNKLKFSNYHEVDFTKYSDNIKK